jgi:hypothetical protein
MHDPNGLIPNGVKLEGVKNNLLMLKGSTARVWIYQFT